MDGKLNALYAGYAEYRSLLRANIAVALRPEIRQAAGELPELTSEDFCVFWERIDRSAPLRRAWLRRLAPQGFNLEQHAVSTALSRAIDDLAPSDADCRKNAA